MIMYGGCTGRWILWTQEGRGERGVEECFVDCVTQPRRLGTVLGNVENCQTDLLGCCPGRVRRSVYVPSCVHRAAQRRVQVLFRRIEMGHLPDAERVLDGYGSVRTVRSSVCHRAAA